jgi:hypothetical protein
MKAINTPFLERKTNEESSNKLIKNIELLKNKFLKFKNNLKENITERERKIEI